MFGDRADDHEEPKADRRDRFRQLEAKQREKEGIVETGTRGLQVPPMVNPPRHPPATQDSNRVCEYTYLPRRSPADTVIFKATRPPSQSDFENEGTFIQAAHYDHFVCALELIY